MLKADTIIANARIFEFGKELADGRAVAIKAGRILDVGEHEDVLSLAGKKTHVINLEGGVLIPGFFDSHLHLASFGHSLRRISLDGSKTLEEALERIKSSPDKDSDGGWIVGRGWDKNLWGEKFPTAAQLDAITGQRPAAFSSRCGHVLWANSAAMKEADVTSSTPDPVGGEVERDKKGSPTGIFKESAISLIKKVRPVPGLEETKSGILDAVKKAHELGVTSVVTLASSTEVSALCELDREGRLDLRVHAYVEGSEFEEIEALEKLGLRLPLCGERFSLAGLKYYVDGSLGGQTAYMFEPYSDSEGCGIPVTHGESLRERIVKASIAGIPCAVHAIGDRAVSDALSAMEASREVHPSLRHRVEHAQVLREEDIARFASSNIIASMQPVHIFGDIPTAERYWGQRCRYAYALRSLLDSGAVVALGTDCPIERLDPMLGLFAACAREPEDGGEAWYPEEAITLEEAVCCYTSRGAYAACVEDRRGEIRPGMEADLAVLREDFFDMKLRELFSTRVEMTFFSGRPVYAAPGD